MNQNEKKQFVSQRSSMHRSLYRPKACSQHVNWTDLNNWTPLHLALIGHAPATVYSTHLDLGWFPPPPFPTLSSPFAPFRSLAIRTLQQTRSLSSEHMHSDGTFHTGVRRSQTAVQFNSVQFSWCEQVFIVKHVLWQHSKRTAFAETRLHTRHQTTPSDKLQSKLITVGLLS